MCVNDSESKALVTGLQGIRKEVSSRTAKKLKKKGCSHYSLKYSWNLGVQMLLTWIFFRGAILSPLVWLYEWHIISGLTLGRSKWDLYPDQNAFLHVSGPTFKSSALTWKTQIHFFPKSSLFTKYALSAKYIPHNVLAKNSRYKLSVCALNDYPQVTLLESYHFQSTF